MNVRDPLPGVIYPREEQLRAWVEAGALPTRSLVEALSASFAAHSDSTALATPSGDVSYAELDAITDRVAAGLLGLGLVPLERVLFQAGNSPELIYAVLGCLKAGLIPVCTLAGHRGSEMGYLGRHVDASAHIVDGDDPKFDLEAFAAGMRAEIPTIRHIVSLRGPGQAGTIRLAALIDGIDREEARATVAGVPRDPFQVAVFQLSGGTTGVPKVIPRMQNDYLLNAELTIETLGYRPDDVMFMPMPMIHNASMICFWLPTLLTGATFAIPADMTPSSWADSFARSRPTFVGLIRALMPRLEATFELLPSALASVRAFWAPDAAQVLRSRYGKPAYAMFGMSEGMNLYCREGDPDEALDWTVGRPLSPFDEVRLVEPGTEREVAPGEIGEMICRGPYTLRGYYNAPERNVEAFTSQGFYKPGDLMVERVIAGETYYSFAGRTKDVVDRGAEKINCEEVENAVSTHPAVAGCAVVGMPDPVLGERVCAFVVLRAGALLPQVPEMQGHLRSLGLAKFKWPERIEAIDELPLTKVGKIDKAALRSNIVALLERSRSAA